MLRTTLMEGTGTPLGSHVRRAEGAAAAEPLRNDIGRTLGETGKLVGYLHGPHEPFSHLRRLQGKLAYPFLCRESLHPIRLGRAADKLRPGVDLSAAAAYRTTDDYPTQEWLSVQVDVPRAAAPPPERRDNTSRERTLDSVRNFINAVMTRKGV